VVGVLGTHRFAEASGGSCSGRASTKQFLMHFFCQLVELESDIFPEVVANEFSKPQLHIHPRIRILPDVSSVCFPSI